MPFDFSESKDIPLQLLQLADQRLDEPKHWIKNQLSDYEGGYCLRGALVIDIPATIVEDWSIRNQATNDAEDSLIEANNLKTWPGYQSSVVAFNNAEKTTFKHVKDALTKAIAHRINILAKVS